MPSSVQAPHCKVLFVHSSPPLRVLPPAQSFTNHYHHLTQAYTPRVSLRFLAETQVLVWSVILYFFLKLCVLVYNA
jgi:hypothetical protein